MINMSKADLNNRDAQAGPPLFTQFAILSNHQTSDLIIRMTLWGQGLMKYIFMSILYLYLYMDIHLRHFFPSY